MKIFTFQEFKHAWLERMNKPVSPRRKSPEKKNVNIQVSKILQGPQSALSKRYGPLPTISNYESLNHGGKTVISEDLAK